MDEALAAAGFCITCTSTAAMDAIGAGVPTMVYVDYPENYLDPLAKPMRQEFKESGLLAGIPQIMELAASTASPQWYNSRFRGEDFLNELIHAVQSFKAKDRLAA